MFGEGHQRHRHRSSTVYGPTDREVRIRKIAIDTFSILDSEQTGKVTAFTVHLAFVGLGVPKSVADVKKMFHKIEGVKFDEQMNELDLQDFIVLTDLYDGHVFGEGVTSRMLTFVLRRQENLHRLMHRSHQSQTNHQRSRARRRKSWFNAPVGEEEEEEEVCPIILPDLRTPSAAPQRRSQRRSRTPGTPATISRMRNRWDAGDKNIDLTEIVSELKEFGIRVDHPDFQRQATPAKLEFSTPKSQRKNRVKDPHLTDIRDHLEFEFYSKQLRSHLASRRSTSSMR